MIDKEIDTIFTPSYFGGIKAGETYFDFSEGVNFEVLEEKEGIAYGMLCNLENELVKFNGTRIEVQVNRYKLIEI